MWHVETDYLALLLFILMIFKNRRFQDEYTKRQDAFTVVLLVGLITTVIDIASSMAMNGFGDWWYFEWSMVLYAGTQLLPIAVWVAYMFTIIYNEDWERTRKRIVVLMLPVGVMFIAALTNPWTSLFFTLSPTMEYARSSLFTPLGFGLYGLYAMAAAAVLIGNRKNIKPRANIYLMASFFVISLVAILVQLALPGLLITQSAYAIACVMCDASMEDRQRKQLLQQVLEQNDSQAASAKRVEEASRSKEEFFARVSHDMRTPMNGILGLSDLALQENDMAMVKGDVAKIRDSGEYLLNLINDTLDIQRIDMGNLKLETRVVDGRQLVENVIDMVRPTAQAKNVRFLVESKNVDFDFPTRVDPVRVKQIFMNLLSNAIKFTPEGGTVTLRIECLSHAGNIYHYCFQVADTGVGMSEQFVKSGLYTPFSQESNPVTESFAGSGLGLSIVKRLVDQMGGRIEVETQLGKGTTFSVFLDLQRADRADIDDVQDVEEAASPERVAAGAGANLLLCEDNQLNAEIAIRLLSKKGYKVQVARNGKEGLQRFAESAADEFDAILMDVRMPVMDGLEAALHIRALKRDDAKTVPIIAMTADAFDDDMKKTASAGMNAHLSKPVDAQQMYRILEQQIGK